jgi:lipid A ethanolaminephosphotransferase
MQNLKIKLDALRNKIPAISLTVFNLILAIWLGVILNISFFEKISSLTPYNGIKAQLLLLAAVAIVIAMYNLALQLLTWKWTTKVIAILLVVIGGFSAYFVSNFGVIMNADQIQNMMQTDVREVKDLLSIKYFLWTIFFVILPVLFILLIRIKSEAFLPLIAKKIAVSGVSFVLIGGLLFSFYLDFASIFREHRDLKGMISPQNVIAASFSYYQKKMPKKNLSLIHYGEDAHLVQQVGTQQNLPKLMVLVVGETARAESFSLNGYTKNTNPELAQQNIINFSQVSSCGTATAVSVPCMFSGMPREKYDEQLASHREGLLDIAQRAGYKVTWIDNNSGCKGACDRVETYQIPADIRKKWCDADGECLDGVLVDSLQRYMANIPQEDRSPRLIVLHQMGSHGPAYYKRAPKAFQKFQPICKTNAIQGCTENELINTYDNSIIYTDYILNSVIENLKANSKYQTGFWYLSDHGESTGEKGMYLHGAPYAIAPSQQTHIPMLMWFSPQWQQNETAKMSCLTAQQHQKLSQDNLFPTLLSMLNVQSYVIDPKLNMLEQCTNHPEKNV